MTDSRKLHKPLRVAAYCRVSTEDQDPGLQIDEIHQAARTRGWLVVSEFTDVGFSGAKDHRPQLDAMMAAAAAKKDREFDAVVCWRLDRLGRSLPHLLQLLDQLSGYGVGFESIRDPGISTVSATGKLMLAIVGAFAAFERDLLIERTKAGMARARRQGRHVGRPRRSVPVEAARELLAQGHSLRRVSVMLDVPRGTLARHLREADQEAGSKGPLQPTA